MICTKCGMQNADNSKFCSSCGTQLEAAEATATVDPTTPPYTAPFAGDGAPAQPIPPMAPPMGAPAQAPPPPPQYTGAPGQAPYQPYNGAPVKPYKAEFIMGLIGSIIGIIVFLISFISGIAVSTGLGYYGYAVGGILIAGSLFSLVAFILGFVGTSQVNKGNGKGGILLTVGGGLGFIGVFFNWFTIFYFPLLLTAGIMALARRSKVESGQI